MEQAELNTMLQNVQQADTSTLVYIAQSLASSAAPGDPFYAAVVAELVKRNTSAQA